MKKWLLISGCACSVALSAATFTVTNNTSAGAGSFAQAVDSANGSTGNDINFTTLTPFTIVLATPMPYNQSFTIDGTNSGNGFTLNTSTAQSITSASGVTTTMTNTSGTMAFNVVIAGAADSIITKTGAGTLSLSGANTYGGGTNLNGGDLTLENNAGLGSGTLTMADTVTLRLSSGINASNPWRINSGATATVNVSPLSSTTATLSGNAASTTGSLRKTGLGILVLSGTNEYSGGTTLSVGDISVTNNSALGSGLLTMADSTNLRLSNGINISNAWSIDSGATVAINTATGVTATLSGNGANTTGVLRKAGVGTLVLSGTNLHSGGVSLRAGEVSVTNSSGLGSGLLTIGNGTKFQLSNGINISNDWSVDSGGTGQINVQTGTETLSGDGANTTGVLRKTGSGTLVLSGTNLHSGGTNVNAGQITLENVSGLGTGTLTMAGGTTLALGNGINPTNAISITSGTANINVDTGNTAALLGATAATAGVLGKTGTGTLVISQSNLHTGGTTLSAGQITLENVSGLGGGTLTMEGGATLALGNGINPTNAISITSGTANINVETGNTAALLGATAATAGVLGKTGTGELVLSVANLHTGGTTLSAGQITLENVSGLGEGTLTMAGSTTLAIDSGISPSNDWSINNGASATVNVSAGTGTLSGAAASTSGSLVKTGAGELFLSGNNGYSGGTTLSAGQIDLGSNTGLGTGTLTVADGASLAIEDGITAANNWSINNGASAIIRVSSGTATLTGIASSTTGSFIKGGQGTLVLSGSNGYSGGTTLPAGSIRLNNNNGLGTGTISMANGTTLSLASEINCGNTVNIATGTATVEVDFFEIATISGVIQGSGALNINGELILTGSNTYTGGTNILAGGAVSLGNNNALGTGTLTMNTLTGMRISDGVLVSNTVIMTDQFIQIVVPSGTGTLSGAITGATNFTAKEGAGNLALASTGTFFGDVYVTEGLFTVNGVLTGDVTALSGSTVKGTGTIDNNLTVESGANLTPGNSIGTINVGTLDLLSGSTTNIELNPSSSSAINVTGAANIAGAVNVMQNGGFYGTAGSYEILTAGSLTGEFNPVVTGSLPNFTFSLEYVGNTVNLIFANTGIYTFGLTGNIVNFANYLNEYAPSSLEIDELAGLYGQALVDAINSVSPARNVFGTFVATQTMFSFSHTLNEYLSGKRFGSSRKTAQPSGKFDTDNTEALLVSNDTVDPKSDSKGQYQLWASGFADFVRQEAENQNAPFDFTSQGVLIGFDCSSISNLLLGGALGYANSQITIDSHMGESNINYAVASLYANYLWRNFYAEGVLWGGYNQIKNNRYIAYADVQRNAQSTVNGGQIAPHVELGVVLESKLTDVEPYISVDYVAIWQSSYTENGAGSLNMHVDGQSSSMIQTEVGVRYYQEVERSYGRFGCKEAASYINRTPFSTGDITAAIFGATEFVTLTSFTEAQNLGAVSAMLYVQPGKRRDATISIGYQGQFGSEYIFNEVLLRLSKNF